MTKGYSAYSAYEQIVNRVMRVCRPYIYNWMAVSLAYDYTVELVENGISVKAVVSERMNRLFRFSTTNLIVLKEKTRTIILSGKDLAPLTKYQAYPISISLELPKD